MNRIKTLKELSKVFSKYDCNIYEFCYYLGITNVKEDISNKDLLVLLDKCSELSGEYTDPIEVGQSLANEVYKERSITIKQLKNLDTDRFYDWYLNGREIGTNLNLDKEMEME